MTATKRLPHASSGEDEKALDLAADVVVSLLRKADAEDMTLKRVFSSLERNVIVKTLVSFNGHQAKSANFLRILPTTLSAKMKKHRVVIEAMWTTNIDGPMEDDGARGEGPDPEDARGPDLDPES